MISILNPTERKVYEGLIVRGTKTLVAGLGHQLNMGDNSPRTKKALQLAREQSLMSAAILDRTQRGEPRTAEEINAFADLMFKVPPVSWPKIHRS